MDFLRKRDYREITLIQPYFYATESIGRRSYYLDVKATEDISLNEPSLDWNLDIRFQLQRYAVALSPFEQKQTEISMPRLFSVFSIYALESNS